RSARSFSNTASSNGASSSARSLAFFRGALGAAAISSASGARLPLQLSHALQERGASRSPKYLSRLCRRHPRVSAKRTRRSSICRSRATRSSRSSKSTARSSAVTDGVATKKRPSRACPRSRWPALSSRRTAPDSSGTATPQARASSSNLASRIPRAAFQALAVFHARVVAVCVDARRAEGGHDLLHVLAGGGVDEARPAAARERHDAAELVLVAGGAQHLDEQVRPVKAGDEDLRVAQLQGV